MREYGAEAVTMLVREALNHEHKPPLVANSVSKIFENHIVLSNNCISIPIILTAVFIQFRKGMIRQTKYILCHFTNNFFES
jgi:hypothetical protein